MGAVARVHRVEQRRDVELDRALRDRQLGGDLLVLAALRHQQQHFELARREARDLWAGARGQHIESLATGGHLVQRRRDVRHRARLADEAGRPRGACARGECGFFVARDHQARHEGMPGAEEAQAFEAVFTAQAVVDQHDVGRALRGARHALGQRERGLHFEVGTGVRQRMRKADTEQRVIVDKQEFHGAVILGCGPGPRPLLVGRHCCPRRRIGAAPAFAKPQLQRPAARSSALQAGAGPVAGRVAGRRADAGASLWRISWQMASLTTRPTTDTEPST
ncbi:hypothetical protein D3C71_1351060 [compost metagenome]